jgi:tetratricopeptide (TPR) repeat protein
MALNAAPALAGQSADPKAEFVRALGRFSLDLDGAFGDEGSAIRIDLESLEQGLAHWDATIHTFETAMAADLRTADAGLAGRLHAALGGVYLERNRMDDALREFTAATTLDPARADFFTLQGLAYAHPLVNKQTLATEAFRKAAALDPRDPVRAYVLARHLVKLGELEEAKSLSRTVDTGRNLHPTTSGSSSAPLFVRPDLVQERSGIEPFFPPASYAEGFDLLRQSEYTRAITQLKETAARDPLTQPAVKSDAMARAAAAFREGLVPAAVTQLEAAIKQAPEWSEPRRILGLVYMADEQHDKGLAELEAAVKLSPHDERARLALADSLVEATRYPAAEQALRQTLEEFPRSGRARYALGRLYQRQGQYPEALREFETSVTFNPMLGLNGIFQSMGAMYAARQEFDAAIDAYSKRADVHPNDAESHQDLGDTYARVGRHDEALAEFAVVLMLDPRHARAYAAIAQVHLKDGRYAEAAEAAQRALDLDPTRRQARYTLATSLIRLGKADEGRKELELFQRLQAEATAAQSRELELDGLRREAAVNSQTGNHTKAVELLRKALLDAPEEAASYMDLGLALLKAGQPAEAIERLRTAEQLNAPLQVHRHLADAYAALGQLEESRREQATFERLKQEQLRQAGANR